MSSHSYEKKIQCLNSYLQDYQRQIGQIQQELERTRTKLNTSAREQEDIKRALTQKEDAVTCFESQLDNLRFELKEKDRCHQRQTGSLQEQVCRLQEQVQQKDSALIMCRNEVKSHLSTMEDVKANFACELKQRENVICQLKEEMKRLYEDMKNRSEECRQLDRNVLDLKAKYSQLSARLNEADVTISCLQEKMQQQENQFSQEKQQAVGDMDELERKLSQTSNDLYLVQNELRKTNRQLQEKEECLEQMSVERSSLIDELQNEREETNVFKERVNALEFDNKEICRLLQQKIHCITDLEQSLCMKKQELETCRCCVEDLNTKIRELNTANGISQEDDTDGNNGAELTSQLKACKANLSKVQAEKGELEKKHQYAVNEMEKLAGEVKMLKCELEEATAEISAKESMIADLNTTLDNAEQDMECRLVRVGEQLQKYERELKEKTRMVGECEEKCCRYQQALADKDMEVDQMDQELARAKMENDSLNCKLHELEESRNCLQKTVGEERARYAELCQENQVNRDMVRTSSLEVTELKRVFALCQRDLEQYMRDNDEMTLELQEKGIRISSLTEEKGCLNAKLANVQCRLEQETKQLSQQMADVKFQLENQINQLTINQNSLEEVNCKLKQKVASGQRQLAEMEKNYYQKVNALDQEVNTLRDKLMDKEDQLQTTKDCLIVKDSEITRLKLRMCGIDQCNAKEEEKSATPCMRLNRCSMRNGTRPCGTGESCSSSFKSQMSAKRNYSCE